MIIHGIAFGWFETGLEGTVWAIQENDSPGYDGLYVVEEGDHLCLISPEGNTVFEGIIDPDHSSGPEGKLRGRNQPTSCGHWIHWYQRGFNPDAWGRFFLSDNHRAVLTRSESTNKKVPQD